MGVPKILGHKAEDDCGIRHHTLAQEEKSVSRELHSQLKEFGCVNFLLFTKLSV